ncbi:hypothetical protein QCD60_17025 [Pokkaliibacter sp. MBI-7]|uniref:hypothetical protein n=1 Tax=Pokkaliibacter sp. MBI-7 TaxID=3040600 RepID=UPI00244D1E2A|nr:hypothetical protein [Pokkaliibacter sp. MBI-7]MDH2434263.1 hypothetical protein [Pokkaliibacter sp. MBI-7]
MNTPPVVARMTLPGLQPLHSSSFLINAPSLLRTRTLSALHREIASLRRRAAEARLCGQLNEAIHLLRQAQPLIRQSSMAYGPAVHAELALAMQQAGDLAGARLQLEESLAIADELCRGKHLSNSQDVQDFLQEHFLTCLYTHLSAVCREQGDISGTEEAEQLQLMHEQRYKSGLQRWQAIRQRAMQAPAPARTITPEEQDPLWQGEEEDFWERWQRQFLIVLTAIMLAVVALHFGLA